MDAADVDQVRRYGLRRFRREVAVLVYQRRGDRGRPVVRPRVGEPQPPPVVAGHAQSGRQTEGVCEPLRERRGNGLRGEQFRDVRRVGHVPGERAFHERHHRVRQHVDDGQAQSAGQVRHAVVHQRLDDDGVEGMVIVRRRRGVRKTLVCVQDVAEQPVERQHRPVGSGASEKITLKRFQTVFFVSEIDTNVSSNITTKILLRLQF